MGNNRSQDEFATQIGNRQQPGPDSRHRVYGLAQSPGSPTRVNPAGGLNPAQTAATDSMNKQVQSVYSGRPIGAYDFCHNLTTGQGDPSIRNASFQAPEGYTMVVTRVEFEFFPVFEGGSQTSYFDLRLTVDGVALQENNLRLYGLYERYTWDTYHVFGFWQQAGVAWSTSGTPITGDIYEIPFRIFGTLIPSRSLDPKREIGSLPLRVRNT